MFAGTHDLPAVTHTKWVGWGGVGWGGGLELIFQINKNNLFIESRKTRICARRSFWETNTRQYSYTSKSCNSIYREMFNSSALGDSWSLQQ